MSYASYRTESFWSGCAQPSCQTQPGPPWRLGNVFLKHTCSQSLTEHSDVSYYMMLAGAWTHTHTHAGFSVSLDCSWWKQDNLKKISNPPISVFQLVILRQCLVNLLKGTTADSFKLTHTAIIKKSNWFPYLNGESKLKTAWLFLNTQNKGTQHAICFQSMIPLMLTLIF